MQRIYHNVTWSRPLDIILVQAQRQSRNVTADWQRKSTHQGSARRASTHENDCKKMGFWTRVGGARGRERNQIHKVASFLKGQPQGGRRTQSGMRTWSQALRASRGEVLDIYSMMTCGKWLCCVEAVDTILHLADWSGEAALWRLP